MPIYAPTQTDEWSFCPYKRYLSQRGWRPSAISSRDVAAIFGRAFATGMCVYNRVARVRGLADARRTPRIAEHAVKAAVATLFRSFEQWNEQGLEALASPRPPHSIEHLEQAVRRMIVEDPTPVEWKVLCAEKLMPNHGYAKADVVYETPHGERVVRDYKFTLTAPLPRYIPSRLEDYANRTQGWHYLWMHQGTVFIPTLVVAHPFKVYELPTRRTPEEITQWHAQQVVKWQLMSQMDRGELPMWRSSFHKDQYGKCLFYELCVRGGGKEEALPHMGFVRVARNENW